MRYLFLLIFMISSLAKAEMVPGTVGQPATITSGIKLNSSSTQKFKGFIARGLNAPRVTNGTYIRVTSNDYQAAIIDNDSGFNAAAGTYTIPAGMGGAWYFVANASVSASQWVGVDGKTRSWIVVNGVDKLQLFSHFVGSAQDNPGNPHNRISGVVIVNAGDVIRYDWDRSSPEDGAPNYTSSADGRFNNFAGEFLGTL